MKYIFSLFILSLYPSLAPAQGNNSPTTALAESVQVRARSLAFPSLEEAMKPDSSTTPWIQKLNGNWKFSYAADPTKKVAGFSELSFDDSSWKEIAVPSNWQIKDYGKPTILSSAQPIRELKSIGQYRHEFTIPDDWKSRKTSLCFDGVDSAFTLWINGKRVGFAEDSRSSQEFDITTFLIEGKNMLAVEVYQFSGHTPDQKREGFQLSGIYRDVYLRSRHAISLDDKQIRATLADDFTTGQLNCDLTIANSSPADAEIKATLTLTDAQGASLATPSSSVKVIANQSAKLVLKSENIAQIKAWSAESPQLYRAYLSLQDGTGKSLAIHRFDIGFRRSEMKDGKYFHNGKNITLKGVSRVDFHSVVGHAMTEDMMKTELLQLKRGNFNAIWNDHSPCDESFLALCDRMGFYLIEAVNNIDIPANAMDLRKQRITHLVTTRRNHPSVIAWLTADGSEKSIFHQLDGTRPVLEQSFVEAFIPLKDFSISKSEVIPGAFEDPLPKIPPLPGVVPPAVDPNAAPTPPRPKMRRYTIYGADIDPQITDAYYGGKGLLLDTNNPKPVFEEWKKRNQEISTRVSDINGIPLSVVVRNKRFFRSLSDVKGSWKLMKNGLTVASGELEVGTLQPQQEMAITVALSEKIDPLGEYFFRARFDLLEANAWHPVGMPIAWEEIPLPWGKRVPATLGESPNDAGFKENDSQVELIAQGASAVIDKKTGMLISWKMKNQEMLIAPLALNFWRANSPGRSEVQRVWQKAGSEAKVTSFLAGKENKMIVVKVALTLAAGQSTADVTYRWNNFGKISIGTELHLDPAMPDLPVIGYQTQVMQTMANVRWYGKGPGETYPDRDSSAWTTIHQNFAPQMFFRHPKPQESGNRSGIRWLELTNMLGGWSLRAESADEQTLNLICYPYGVNELDQAKNLTEIPKASAQVIHINHRQSAVDAVQESTRLAASAEYHWTFLLSSQYLPPSMQSATPGVRPQPAAPQK